MISHRILTKPSVVLDSGLIFLQFVIGVLCFDVLSQVPIATGYVFDEHENVGESSLNEEQTTGDLRMQFASINRKKTALVLQGHGNIEGST